MNRKWITDFQVTTAGGVNAAFAPDEIAPDQIAWAKNVANRGGRPHTRPAIRQRLVLPKGHVQGVSFFSRHGGMLVLSIGGQIWRVRVRGESFTRDQINLPTRNSARRPQAWMCETNESLIIQDGESRAIIYDGASARRSDPAREEVPLGRMMAYGNGRLWLAINDNEVVAGDIVGTTPGSELVFSETTYLLGGGALYFPQRITGLSFLPVNDTSTGFGPLMVFGRKSTAAVRADIANRDQWSSVDGFVNYVFRKVGAASHASITEVNQDIYFRSGEGDIRSLRTSIVDQSAPGNSPISREVGRIVDNDSQDLLETCSSIFFDNRMLMTASPYLNIHGGVSFRDLIALDFAPISSNRGKSTPAYDGEWDGLHFSRLVAGEFAGRDRAFAISTDPDGENRLWEFMPSTSAIADASTVFVGAEPALVDNPIQSVIEYRRFNFNAGAALKRLERLDLYLSGLDGTLDLAVYWRADNRELWQQWDEITVCATTTDDAQATNETPHTFRRLTTQSRSQVRTFTIPDAPAAVDSRHPAHVGYAFQIRLVWTGRVQVDRIIAHAEVLPETDWANRDEFPADCRSQDVTGNDVHYHIPVGGLTAYIDQDEEIYADKQGIPYTD